MHDVRESEPGSLRYRVVWTVVLCTVLAFAAPATSAQPPHSKSQGIRTPTYPTVFSYSGFAGATGLVKNGTVSQVGQKIQLVEDGDYSAGSLWYINQVDVAQGFTTNFKFQIVPDPASSTPADGMAFVIQNAGLGAISPPDGEPGYENIPNSLAVEFDTFLNEHLTDPNNNHVGIQSCGTAPNTLDHNTTCNLGLQPTLPITLTDHHAHVATITYDPSVPVLSISIDNQPVLSSNLDLSTLLSLNGNDAWVGFTAGVGADFEHHYLLNWAFATQDQN